MSITFPLLSSSTDYSEEEEEEEEEELKEQLSISSSYSLLTA
jgi:hypothetical protein